MKQSTRTSDILTILTFSHALESSTSPQKLCVNSKIFSKIVSTQQVGLTLLPPENTILAEPVFHFREEHVYDVASSQLWCKSRLIYAFSAKINIFTSFFENKAACYAQ